MTESAKDGTGLLRESLTTPSMIPVYQNISDEQKAIIVRALTNITTELILLGDVLLESAQKLDWPCTNCAPGITLGQSHFRSDYTRIGIIIDFVESIFGRYLFQHVESKRVEFEEQNPALFANLRYLIDLYERR